MTATKGEIQMTLEQKKETADKILTVLDGLTYADAYSILGWTQDKLAINSFVSAHSPEALQECSDKRQCKDELTRLAFDTSS